MPLVFRCMKEHMGLDGELAHQPVTEFAMRPGLAQELQGTRGGVKRGEASGRNQC